MFSKSVETKSAYLNRDGHANDSVKESKEMKKDINNQNKNLIFVEKWTIRKAYTLNLQIQAINEKNERVGYINYSDHRYSTNYPCSIQYIYVEEKHREQGIGSNLVKKALTEQFNSGCEKVSLNAYQETYGFFSKRRAQPSPDNPFGIFDHEHQAIPMEIGPELKIR
ncbi:MAG: GNAT family N-acetyltransferase [Tatlockia sp.]|nr:GNAT family N-acetyltransferase [Tatlockia sp.]